MTRNVSTRVEFLDEVAELPTTLQAKLLRAIQERTIERLGSNVPLPIDFRLITATAQDRDAAVAAGTFREDLQHGLNVVRIHLPPLRKRTEDIPLLVQRFLSRSERPVSIREDALDRILSHTWPGNVRELENVITRAIMLAPGGVITPESIRISKRNQVETPTLESHIPHRDGYWAALHEAHGNKAEAARILGVQRRLLYERMTEFGLN